MSFSGWLARPKESREAILKELRAQAKEWASGGDDWSQEDADTLLAAVELLDRIDKDLDP